MKRSHWAMAFFLPFLIIERGADIWERTKLTYAVSTDRALVVRHGPFRTKFLSADLGTLHALNRLDRKSGLGTIEFTTLDVSP